MPKSKPSKPQKQQSDNCFLYSHRESEITELNCISEIIQSDSNSVCSEPSYEKPEYQGIENENKGIEDKNKVNDKEAEIAKEKEKKERLDSIYKKHEEYIIKKDNINTTLDQLISHSPLDAVRNILSAENDIKDKIFSGLKNYTEEINPELILKQIEVKKHIVAEALFASSTFGHSHKDAIFRFDTLFGDMGQKLLEAIEIKQEDVMISVVDSKAVYPTEAKFREQIVGQLANFINNNITPEQITQDLAVINQNYFDSLWGETGDKKLQYAIKSSDLCKEIKYLDKDEGVSPNSNNIKTNTFKSLQNVNIHQQQI
jgi:hypothetical protein